MAVCIPWVTPARVMKITLTNGVSFSLVAGAICMVYFANAISKTYIDNNGTTRTLNIASTGAKEIHARYSSSNGHHEQAINSSWALANSTLLCVYSGSYYYTPSYGYIHSYDDYSEG